MRDEVSVAAIALDSQAGCTAENLDKIARWSRLSAERGADLVLFPELSVTGFFPNHPVSDHATWLSEVLRGAWRAAEPLDGAAIRQLESISAGAGIFIAAGLLENAGNVLYNTHVLVGEGRVWARWRKMHIPLFEMQVYNGGGVPDVVDTPLGRVGANICFDALLPESTRLLGVQGCEIALFPFAADPPPGTARGWADWAGPVLRARCAENGVYGVACNYLGGVAYAGATQRFPGGAMIVAPDGALVSEQRGDSREPHLLMTHLHRQGLVDARSQFEYTFRFRRPELYGLLANGPRES